MNQNVVTDQEKFFNLNAASHKVFDENDYFYRFAIKEQLMSLEWLSDSKKILEYGVGTGTSIDVFLRKRNVNDYDIYGVDIAEEAVKKAREKYPTYHFFKITDNNLDCVENDFFDSCYMFHLLHHASGYDRIFAEIAKKLKPGGRLVINDLSSNNLFIRLGRKLFATFPKLFKYKFEEDLVVDGKIPDKYPVDPLMVVNLLENCGYKVEKVIYGHLFLHVFGWLDRLIPLSKIGLYRSFLDLLCKIENNLLKKSFWQNKAELFCILAVKI